MEKIKIKKIIIVLIVFVSLSVPILAKASLDLSTPMVISSEKQLIELRISLIQKLISLLQELINAINKNNLPAINDTVVPDPVKIIDNKDPVATSLEPLTFTETPKLVWRKLGKDSKGDVYRLAYITWKTNRDTKLILSPVVPDETGWTTKFGAEKSCDRTGLSYDVNSKCKIIVEDNYKNTIEKEISVFNDSIIE